MIVLIALLATAVFVFLLLIAVAWIGMERALRRPPRAEEHRPADYCLPVEEVSFPSRDGLRLAGWFVPGGNGATIVLLHGYGRSRAELLPHADYLHRAGYSLLMLDFRSRGESEGKIVTVGVKEPLDVLGTLDYLKSRPDVDSVRIGLQGVSLGAMAGLIAMAQSPEVKGLVAEGGFTTIRSVLGRGFQHFTRLPPLLLAGLAEIIGQLHYGLRPQDVQPIRELAKINPRSIFFIHGLEDDLIPPEESRRLYEAARGGRELWLVPEAAHARAIEAAPEEYQRRVLAFWERCLGDGG